MEGKQEKSKIVQFGNKMGEKAAEIGNKVGEKAKITFEHLNFLKYFTDLDKEISKNEKEKAAKIIDAIKDIDDDELKAETLKGFIDSNHRKEIIEKIIYAAKYLSGAIAVVVVAAILKKGDQKLIRVITFMNEFKSTRNGRLTVCDAHRETYEYLCVPIEVIIYFQFS